MPRLTLALVAASLLLQATPALAGETPGLQQEKPAAGRFVETSQGFMTPYEQTIPGTKVRFKMMPVAGGVAELGDGRRVKLPPYWIAEREVSWAEYWPYMALDGSFTQLVQLRTLAQGSDGGAETVAPLLKKYSQLRQAIAAQPEHVDGVTAPTPLYYPEITYESGKEPELPAVTMTPYAAKQYTKWLSRIVEIEYRLPSEAEWEHAARAGGPGPYGATAEGEPITADSLVEHAWLASNSNSASQPCGKKKPNAWGLYDMLGNAAEWVLDEVRETTPSADAAAGELDWRQAVAWPVGSDQRIAKGGYWEANAEDCRVGSRLISNDEDWKYSDPNIPKSPWWFSDEPAFGVGFRVVRPLEPMTAEDKRRVWEINNEDIQFDVDARLEEGRGKIQAVDKHLPAALQELAAEEVQELID